MLRLLFPPPPHQKAYAGGEEAGAEAAIDPGKKVGGYAGNMLKADAEGDHEGNYEIALETEGLPYAGLLFGHRIDTGGVFADHSREHHIEAGENQH